MNFVSNAARKGKKWGVICVLGVLALGALEVFGTAERANAASITLTIPQKIDLSVPSDGTFKASEGGAIEVSTDAIGGYTLSIKANKDDAGKAILENGSNKLQSITDAGGITEEVYKASGHLNTWAYLPSMYNSQANSNYLPGPTATKATLNKTNQANAGGVKDNYTVKLAAKVDKTTLAGAYSNTFTISAEANPVSYTITYNLNNGSWTEGSNQQTGSTIASSVKLLGTTPTKEKNQFVGWCDQVTTDDTCDGAQYDPGSDFPLTSGDNKKTLYAMWEGPQILTSDMLTSVYTATTATVNFVAGDGIEVFIVADNSSVQKPYYAFPGTNVSFSSASNKKYILTVVPKSGYVLDKGLEVSTAGTTTTVTAKGKVGMYQSMQDLDDSQCTVEGTNVTDDRDGKSYSVAKIGGRCYMLSNLRLEAGTTITPTDSNVSSNFTLPDKSVSDAWTSSSQNWYGKASMKECKGPIGNNTGSNTCTDNTVGVTEYYYNWYAAKANPNTSGTSTSSSSASSTNDNKSLGSICPKGWILPTNYSTDNTTDLSYSTLWNSGNNPAMLITSGYFGSGSQYVVGSSGYWWSSTRGNDDNAYSMYLYSGGTSRNNNAKYNGISVRCMR